MKFKTLLLEIDHDRATVSGSDAFQKQSQISTLTKQIEGEVVRVVRQMWTDIDGGKNLAILAKLPVLNMAPLLSLLYATRGAEDFRLND